MTLHEYPYYGLGIVAYCVANSDGSIQQRERRELMNLVESWSKQIETGFNVSEVIFSILTKTNKYEVLTYEKGLEYIRKGREHLSPKLKERFIFLINDIAHSFPPVTEEERQILERFENDLKHL